ncbi:MAG: hypothetical protein KDA75_15435 [Planctomycetaceae bacterium]|nr:hypothetical protein [Planctomycetaceae bacterium]
MARLIAIAFVLLLAVAHLDDPHGLAYSRPLSLFRDCEPAWIGDALFSLLTLLGLAVARTAWRVQCRPDVVVYLSATALLGFVATTPSLDEWHNLGAVLLMVLLFGYYAAKLHWAEEFAWLVLHLAVPSILVFASRTGGYGIWQKAMILYFCAAILVHEAILAQWLPHRRMRPTKTLRIQVGRLPLPARNPPSSMRDEC